MKYNYGQNICIKNNQITNVFEIDESVVVYGAENEIISSFTSSPTFVKPQIGGNMVEGSFRLIFRKDDILFIQNNCPVQFQTCIDTETGIEYLVSASLVEINVANQPFFNSLSIVTYLNIKKPTQLLPFDFNREFVGWNLIMDPFICFVKGLAAIPHMQIYARFFHLIQSSGCGKTRLCFEYLKYQKMGIYCVYRSFLPGRADTGYPKTTEWLQQLISKFRNSDSDANSVNICLEFIYWAIGNFYSLEKKHFKQFLGERTFIGYVDFSVSRSVNDIKTLLGQKSVNLFTIVIDECQELLITPDNRPHLISLYRAFKRALHELRECPIVTVFLGTKSSLGDFVLSGHYRPSAREELAMPGEELDVPVYLFTHTCNSMLNRRYKVTYDSVATLKTYEQIGISLPRSLVMQSIAWSCGRPLWRQYESFEKAFKIANRKLIDDASLKELASIILRTGSTVVPQDQLAHRLVLSGMATLTYVDVTGSRCYMEYIPEPILSNNARLIMNNKDSYIRSLDEYVKRLELGVFHESGEAGEQVARIVLLRIMDMICLFPKRGAYSGSPDLNSFHYISAIKLFGEDPGYQQKAINFADRLDKIRRDNFAWRESPQSPPLPTSNINLEASQSSSSSSSVNPNSSASQSPSAHSDISNPTSSSSSSSSNSDAQNAQSSPVSGDSCGNDFNLDFFSPSISLTTVRQFLLYASNGSFDEELSKFGVSDAVLDGALSACQFVKVQNPMNINQVYMMHAFARGCGLILANEAVGVDLLFPVLRTDNKMSCIVFQIKNIQTSSFPNDEKNVVDKLQSSKLNYLDFRKIGKFEEAPADDFIRIVIQFGLEENESEFGNNYHWSKIPSSIAPSSPRSQCQALWLYGLKALEHCFFKDDDILYLLNNILSGRRDFYSNLSYPRYPLPTYVQSTEEGARFLGRLARPLGNFANLTPFDIQLRDAAFDLGKYEWDCAKKNLKFLQMSEDSLNHFQNSEISPNGPDHSAEELCQGLRVIDCATLNAPATEDTQQRILSKVITNCATPNDGIVKFKNEFAAYKSETEAIRTPDNRIKRNKTNQSNQ